MDIQTQIDRLIELAIVQRTELKQLVEQLPELREHLNAEVEKVFDEVEPQLRVELEDWTAKQTADQTAKLGASLEAKITELAKALEVSTQARYSAILAEREKNFALAAEAEAKIAEHAASLPEAVKGIVDAELARFPRAGEIDQLRKEFAEPRGLNPRGKWQSGETYNKLDLVAFNGDSFVSNIDGNTEKPNRGSTVWTLSAARGVSGGGGGATSLTDLVPVPQNGELLIGNGSAFVNNTLTAGTGVTITNGAGTITIDASGAQEILTATVKNADSVAITKGQVVYLFSATGGFPSVKLAYNTSDATSAKTFGVVSDTSIAPNGTGTITCVGVVSNLNLGAYNDGDTVYLGATPGSFTATKPYAPNHLVYVGIIERANSGNGELYVRIQNGYELDEIHDVQINSPRQDGQTLIYDATAQLWKNARLTAGVGVAITNGASAITISADGGVNYQGTWNASTNTPTLTSSVGTKGFYYVVSVAGSTNLNGVTDWKVGDWAIFNGTAWEKVDTTDQVSSVFGRTGAVVGVSTDYSSVGITNTAIGASNPSTGAFTTLSASGAFTANATTDSSSKDTGAIVTEGGLGVEKSATIGGNLTVSGTLNLTQNQQTKFGSQPAFVGDGTTFYLYSGGTGGYVFRNANDTSTLASLSNAGNLTVSGTGTSTFGGKIQTTSANGIEAIVSSGNTGLSLQSGTTQYSLYVNKADDSYRVYSSIGNTDRLMLTSGGNFLVGSTVDGGQKLQVAGTASISGNLTVSGNTTLGSGNTYPIYGYSGYLQFSGLTSGRFVAAGTYRPDAAAGTDDFQIQTYNGSAWSRAAVFSSTSSTILGNLTVSGTGTSTIGGDLTVTGTGGGVSSIGRVGLNGIGPAGVLSITSDAKTAADAIGLTFLGKDSANNAQIYAAIRALIEDPTSTSEDGALQLFTVSAGTVAEKARLTGTGNFLLKSDGVDGGNGKLQLATHTTSAGGIGFGTDISLYRPQAGVLAIDGSQAALYLRDSGTTKGRFNVTASTLYIDGVDASGSTGQIILRTGNGGGTALTLDSSQVAKFASSVAVNGTTTSQALHVNVDVYGNSKSGGMRIGNSGNNYYSDLLITTDGSANPTLKQSFATHTLSEYGYAGAGNSWKWYTNNTLALTLDSSQRCILAGALRLNNAYTAGAPTATGYVTIQDSAGNTYKVLVGT